MTAANGTRPASRTAVVAKLRRLKVRHDRATAALLALEEERVALYQEARDLDPAITFREIAGIFEITEAAVMQKLRRGEKASAS